MKNKKSRSAIVIKSIKKTQRRFEIRFQKEKYKDIIDYIETHGGATYIKDLIIKDVRKSNN